MPHAGDGDEKHGDDGANSEMTRLATAEVDFRLAVQREQAALMDAGLGRIEVREGREKEQRGPDERNQQQHTHTNRQVAM